MTNPAHTIRDTLTAEERASVEAFVQAKHEETEAELSAEDAHVAKFIDAFEAATERGTGPGLIEAFAVIAASLFNDDPQFQHEGVYDAASGLEIRPSQPNNASYNQMGFLGQMCRQADWQLKRELQRQTWLERQARQLARAGDDEITREQRRAVELDYGKSRIVNVPLLEDLLYAAKLAYRTTIGEEWTPPVSKSENKSIDIDRQFDHARPARARL
jgi:hypothetical protein